MPDAYATPAELQAWLPTDADPLVDPGRLLSRASELLDDTVRAAFEIDDETGIPTDEDTAATMRDACCAQVEFWTVATGEGHDIEGLGGTQVSVPGYSGRLVAEVAPRALRILSAAGMLTIQSGPSLPDPAGILVE